MASRPIQDLLEFHIRLIPGGTVSAFVHQRLAVGDPVSVQGPHGIAHWREAHRGPVIAVAGGSGLAPIKVIVEQILRSDSDAPVTLYFGVRDEQDLYLEGHFLALTAIHRQFRFIPVLSSPHGPTKRRTGLLAAALAQDGGDLRASKAYLAGPPVMVESCVTALQTLGLGDQDCHADAFYTEADKVKLESRA